MRTGFKWLSSGSGGKLLWTLCESSGSVIFICYGLFNDAVSSSDYMKGYKQR
jgi:hypothetical protein